MAQILIAVGLILLISGIILQHAPWLLKWIGHLPGDIHFESRNFKIYIPLTSTLLISIILTFIFKLFGR